MAITIHDIRLESTTYGSIYSRYVELEGKEIDFDGYDPVKKVKFKELAKYPIEDKLDIFISCHGINGAYCTLFVYVDGKKYSPDIKCIINNGVGRQSQTYDV